MRSFSLETFFCLAVLLAATAPSARSDSIPLWSLGIQDESTADFSQENFSSNLAPGSATTLDDDFYFAGIYPAPIGTLTANEPTINFERALTSSDPNNRLHFTLTAAQAVATARFRLTVPLFGGAWWNTAAGVMGKDYGTHIIRVKMNGQVLDTQTFTHDGVLIVTANAAQALPVSGPNTIELSRTGGSPEAWIEIDSVGLEVNPSALVDADGDGLPQYWEQEHGLNDNDNSDAAKDQDKDGLTALQEFTLGTDPQKADSDDDGLTDGFEVNSSHSNPLLADTDADGLSDGDEVNLYGTNPLLADSDSDGAPDAWEVRTGYNPVSNTSTPPAFPYAIGVKFVSQLNPDNGLSALEVSGYVPQMRWNNSRPLQPWNVTTGDTSDIVSPTGGILVNSAGASSAVTMAWSAENIWASGNGGGSNQRLLDGYLAGDSTTPASVTFSGISFPVYDVLVYVGQSYDRAHGFARLNNNSNSDRHFYSGSTRPEANFLEPIGSTASKPWRGNVVRFRNVTGASCNVKVFAVGEDGIGLHAIQIVHATADTDGDGLPDWWEFKYQLKPNSAADATLDPDGDGLTNLQELARGTNPRLADSDGDGLSDLVETGTGIYVNATNSGSNPLLPDSDGDGLTDGQEVNLYHTNPLLSDTDGDGRSDADEIRQRTDPLVSNTATDAMPVVTLTPRTFRWTLDNVQVVWDHTRGLTANQEWGDAYLFTAGVTNTAQSSWGDSLRVGLRVVGGRLVHFLYSGSHGAFSEPSQPANDLWESDWNSPPTDRRAALGFSGYGKADYSARLRFELTATSTGATGPWSLTYEVRNLDTNLPVITKTFTNCTLTNNVQDNSATWQNSDDPAKLNRLSLDKNPAVELYFQATPLASTSAFAAYKDTDKDGMPDVWEEPASAG